LFQPLCQVFPCQPDPCHEPFREPPIIDVLWKLLPWNAPLFDVLRKPLLVVLLVVERNPLLAPSPRLLLKDEPLWPSEVLSVCPELMCPVYPRLPLTDRDAPPNDEPPDPNREPPIELPVSEAECEPPTDELPKCEPSIFDTPRFGEIELRVADEPSALRPDTADDPPKFPAREFEATEGEFDPRDALPAELPEPAPEPANDRAVELPAAELPA
jgi:hypothetical protein